MQPPTSRDQLLALDEVPYDVYLRTRQLGDAPDMLQTARDDHGQLWRAVNLQGMGWRKVRLS